MRYVITGGAGFIGSWVVDRLADAGHDVVVVDNLDPAAHGGRPNYLRDDVDYRWSDVRDASTWQEAMDGVDGIAHLAGKVGLGVDFGDAADYVAHNDVGTVVGLTELHERSWSGRIVLASSMVVYGEGQYECPTHGSVRPGLRTPEALATGDFEPPCPICGSALEPRKIPETTPCEPRNVYAATKLHQEHLCEAFAVDHDVSVASMRFHNVYGPRMPQKTPYAGVASIFRSSLEAGERPRVFEDGGQLRDFVHVTDVAAAVCAALTAADGPTGPFNVASGEARSVGDMARALAAAVDPELSPEIVGGWRDGDVRHVVAAPDRLRAAFDLPDPVPFEVGMAELATAELRDPPADATGA